MQGLEAIMSSWEAQFGIAEAVETNAPILMAFLDYHKFFDSFEPRFFGRLMQDAGIHEDFTRLFVQLNCNAVRFIKIGKTFGNPIKPFNALGQGDPWVLIAAFLYVSTQFNMLNEVAPQVSGTAVIDDRALQGEPEQIDKAIRAIFVFDSLAGHITHPEKITFSSPSVVIRNLVAKWEYDGLTPRMEMTQKLVGDVVTVLKNGSTALPNARLEHAIRTAARIKYIDCSRAAKTHALRTVAVPRMLPSTL